MATPTTRPVYAWETVPAPRPTVAPDPDPDFSTIEDLACREVWRVLPSRKPAGGDHLPLSPDWFRHLESKRYRRYGRWVPGLLEFNRHARESLVAVGDGLGTDWVQYATEGADVSVIDPSADRLRLYRRHFAARDVAANCLHAPLTHWPVGDDRTDVVVAVFNERPAVELSTLAAEAFRTLRPGGKVIAVLPAWYNAARWQDLLLPWRTWFRRERSPRDRYSAYEVRAAFAGFQSIKVYKRHLRRSELPYVWRWMLLPVLERFMGRFLVVKAFKPLTATNGVTLRAAPQAA
jgi:SAM-dependent methyltransferase